MEALWWVLWYFPDRFSTHIPHRNLGWNNFSLMFIFTMFMGHQVARKESHAKIARYVRMWLESAIPIFAPALTHRRPSSSLLPNSFSFSVIYPLVTFTLVLPFSLFFRSLWDGSESSLSALSAFHSICTYPHTTSFLRVIFRRFLEKRELAFSFPYKMLRSKPSTQIYAKLDAFYEIKMHLE